MLPFLADEAVLLLPHLGASSIALSIWPRRPVEVGEVAGDHVDTSHERRVLCLPLQFVAQILAPSRRMHFIHPSLFLSRIQPPAFKCCFPATQNRTCRRSARDRGTPDLSPNRGSLHASARRAF